MTQVLPHHQEAVARGARCLECPLYNCGQGPTKPIINPGSVLTIVGESPDTAAVETSNLRQGAGVDVVYEVMKEEGLQPEHLSFTNAVLCRPPGGHLNDYVANLKGDHKKAVAKAKAQKQAVPPPPLTPQECCAPRLAQDISEARAKTILGLGSEGLRSVATVLKVPYGTVKVPPGTQKVATIKKQHGAPVPLTNGLIITASLHPAFALWSNSTYMPVIKADLKRAAHIAMRGYVNWFEPEFIVKPSIDTCINVIEMMRRAGSLVTVDIETDGIDVQTARIRCIGLGALIDGREVIICVPFRHMDGRPWWLPGDESRLIEALRGMLESNPISGHNLLFDTAVMLKRRILVNRGRVWVDTMLAHHDTNQSELPHDLGFVAARNFEAPRWKDDADHKNVEGVDDYWLHLYCCKDVLGEMRLVMPLLQQINEQGTINAFKTDMALAPSVRDMGDLGFPIHEERRGQYFNVLDKAVKAKTQELRTITGNADYNPNAFKQVSKFLYVTKGLSPPYATDGREWADLASEDEELPIDIEDPDVVLEWAATNEVSLMRLLELGVDAQTQQFIEAQLAYRGLQKCKATQVGYKWEEQDDGSQKLIDTHRKRGFIHTESFGEGLQNLSMFHPSWKLHVVPTGRFATSPNVQNWSERIVWDIPTFKAANLAGKGSKKMPYAIDGSDGIINTRAMVCAAPGHVFVGADYNAIELRIYAIMSGDALLLDAIMNGKDPHSLNYATMMARHPSEVMTWYQKVVALPDAQKKYLRNIAKRFGFLEIYGGQEETLYKTMAADRNPDGTRSFPDLQPKDVKMWHTNFHRAHPECMRWQQQVIRAWHHHGFVATLIDGRRRFFIGGEDPTAMPNMSIQGSAASIANRALLTIAKECPSRGWSPVSGVILQVHDFIGLHVPEKRQGDGEALLDYAMPYEHKGMKFDIERKSGKSWDVI